MGIKYMTATAPKLNYIVEYRWINDDVNVKLNKRGIRLTEKSKRRIAELKEMRTRAKLRGDKVMVIHATRAIGFEIRRQTDSWREEAYKKVDNAWIEVRSIRK